MESVISGVCMLTADLFIVHDAEVGTWYNIDRVLGIIPSAKLILPNMMGQF